MDASAERLRPSQPFGTGVAVSGVTNGRAAARREEVLALWAKGYSHRAIGRQLGVDAQTVKRDVTLLAAQAVAALDVQGELTRLLLSARAVETDRWAHGLPLQALAAQRQQLAVLQVLLGLDTARRVEDLERRLDELTGRPFNSPGTGHITGAPPPALNGSAGRGRGEP